MNEKFKLMKNIKNNKLIYICLIIFILIILIIVSFVLHSNYKDNKIQEFYDKSNSNIVVSKENKEKPGTFIRTLDTLQKSHCIDDICIKNIVIYYIKNNGRIEYEIINKSKKNASGAFKLKFDNGNTTYIVYNKLKKGESRKGLISFSKVDYSNVYDYTIKKLSKDELDKLINSKK